jgi:hypothetical protein
VGGPTTPIGGPASTTGASSRSESTESWLPRAIPSEINMGPNSIMSPLTPMTALDSETLRSHHLPSVSTRRSAPGQLEGNKNTYEDDETIVTDASDGIPGARPAQGPATIG